ncbi:hypothetical protein L596_015474 [Steinernema carpocapsae]|uniref:C2H2-type domain-containing protein n=1 Tax=Steinernema carpocapsae TaxID=34508 RepID=A0A4U5NG37_STECR|nr:hypothetical protein L596_015474 [Steinernema carpocapsae]
MELRSALERAEQREHSLELPTQESSPESAAAPVTDQIVTRRPRKRHPCPQCQRTFSRKTVLEVHISNFRKICQLLHLQSQLSGQCELPPARVDALEREELRMRILRSEV